jgi:hypothetical protein
MVAHDRSGPSGRRAPADVEERDEQTAVEARANDFPTAQPDVPYGHPPGPRRRGRGADEPDESPTSAVNSSTPATQSGAASPYVSADTGHVLLLQRAINDLDDGEELTGGRRVDSCWASTSRRARRRPSAPSASERGMRRGTYAPSTAKSLFLSGETEGHLSLLPPALAQAHQRPTPRRSSRPPPGA